MAKKNGWPTHEEAKEYFARMTPEERKASEERLREQFREYYDNTLSMDHMRAIRGEADE